MTSNPDHTDWIYFSRRLIAARDHYQSMVQGPASRNRRPRPSNLPQPGTSRSTLTNSVPINREETTSESTLGENAPLQREENSPQTPPGSPSPGTPPINPPNSPITSYEDTEDSSNDSDVIFIGSRETVITSTHSNSDTRNIF